MRVLVTGAKGQLGQELLRRAPAGIPTLGLSREEGDITRADLLRKAFESFQPDVVINAAAYTAVDKAETDREQARAVNTIGARNVGVVAREFGARVVHVSTDYVFDGRATVPYPPSAPTNPLSVYGETKRDGEVELASIEPRALIVRTGWLYSSLEQGFVSKIFTRLQQGLPLRVVNDQVGAPTSATDLAQALWECVARPNVEGLQHWVNAGTATWHEFAVAIREMALDLGIIESAPSPVPVSTAEYGSRAARPRYSVLDASDLWTSLGGPPEDWRAALWTTIKEIREERS